MSVERLSPRMKAVLSSFTVCGSVSGPNMKSEGFLPMISSREYSITCWNDSLTHSMEPSDALMSTKLSVRLATRDSLRAAAWLRRRARSASRRSVTSCNVPTMRVGSPSAP